MEFTSLLLYIVAGIMFGWISSTLVEWVWYRGQRRRLEVAVAPSGMRVSGPMSGAPAGPSETSSPRKSRGRSAGPKGDTRSQPKGSGRPRPSRAAGQVQANRPDNLTAIHGIGDLYERRLYQVGIFTWHQLSRMDAEALQQITLARSSSHTQAWVEQAGALANANDRVGAIYDGPLPEDLTRLDGVDHLYEDELYAAGIFTYRQLAECAPNELARIITPHLAGDNVDFAGWIAQAESLRDDYYADEPPIF